MKNVALLIICTNKYIQFLEPLIKSADKFFLKNQNVTYFVFTDKEVHSDITDRNLVLIPTQHRDWPWMALGQYKLFSDKADILSEFDYIFFSDVDMLFVDEVSDEILSDLVGTLHPGYIGRRGTPETNPASTAYVHPAEHMMYFAGAFSGGSSHSYLQLCHILSENVEKDFKDGIIAIWHDESHLNRYFIDNPPSKVLSPSYCYDETKTYNELPFKRKLLALSKNHKEVRSM
jgi:histo-blood group ABO system transferase